MTTPAALIADFWARIDAQDWEGLTTLLAPEFTGHFVHTGERFDRDGFVEFQRGYPGHWRASVDETVQDGDRVVTRTRVSQREETYVVATFATVADGLVTHLVEVWTQAGQLPEDQRRS